MSNLVHLRNRVFNQPLLLEPSYAQVLFGALTDKLDINELIVGGDKLSSDQLKEMAAGYESTSADRKPYVVKNRTAMIDVAGSLVAKSSYLDSLSGMRGYNQIKAELDIAFADGDVDKILFVIDSSGGEVNGCFELCDYIHSKRGNKPMTALVQGMACSAAYAIASTADEILVGETSITGSIGVVTAHTSVEKAMDNKGVKITLITAGKHKADGNPYVDLPDEVKERIEMRLSSIHTMFAERVAKHRGITVDAVFETDALTYLGGDALDVGLVDEVVSSIDYIENLSHTSGSNINLENNMATEHEQALVNAEATGVKTGGSAMQARIKAITTHANAEGRSTLANHLAFNTDMSAEDAVVMMEVAAKETPETVEQPQADSGFQAAMVEESASPVGVVAVDSDSDDTDEMSAFLTQLGK